MRNCLKGRNECYIQYVGIVSKGKEDMKEKILLTGLNLEEVEAERWYKTRCNISVWGNDL